jgi:hypothetical protein
VFPPRRVAGSVYARRNILVVSSRFMFPVKGITVILPWNTPTGTWDEYGCALWATAVDCR